MADNEHPPEDNDPWETHDTELAYENPWIRIEHSNVTTPGGSAGIYGVVRFVNDAVGVVPIDDEDHTWLVGQYRYPTASYSWEMPEGGSPPHETREQTAARELLEETGLSAGTMTPLLSDVHMSNSVTDERAWAFIATDLTQGAPTPEDTEELRLWRLPVDQVIDMVLNDKIADSFTVMAFLRILADRR